jgi:hypothetical protein
VISIGEPKHIRRYCPKYAPSLTCYCCPDTDEHELYGLRHSGVANMFDPELYIESARLYAEGINQGKATGDITMLGGVFIIDTKGLVRYAYVEPAAHVHAPLESVLEKAQKFNFSPLP